jgi:hypothetical protein
MQLPFSEPDPPPVGVFGSSAPDHRGVADARAAWYYLTAPAAATADQSITAIVPDGASALTMPVFEPHFPNDPTPAKEDQAEAWVKEMCIHAHTWRRKLARLTRESDLEKLKQEFAEMYAEHTDATAADFFQRHFRRPDAAADAKPFPIRVALFYILVCTCVAAIILLILLISR